jgi:hypothetical protein
VGKRRGLGFLAWKAGMGEQAKESMKAQGRSKQPEAEGAWGPERGRQSEGQGR